MKKGQVEIIMGILLLAGALFLSREGAKLANGSTKEQKQVVVIDPGQGGV